MKRVLMFSLLLFYVRANGQLLTASRAKHIKECTVRITIDGITSVGSGFISANNGTVITCWHVINPSLIIDSARHSITNRNIVVEFQDGTKASYGIPTLFITKGLSVLNKYDICGIIPLKPFGYPTPFLKLGNFSNVNDGDEIITCGYPLGISKQFISRGMISTKYTDTSYSKETTGAITKTPINLALMDITMNKGNSGGAIYKIGDSEAQDEVIGIADFIITPVGKDVSELLDNLKKSNSYGTVLIQGINTNASMAKTIETISNMSDGVSGCISIEYFQNLAATLKP